MTTNTVLPTKQDDLLEWICEDPCQRIRSFINEKGPIYLNASKVLVHSMMSDHRNQTEELIDDVFNTAMTEIYKRAIADPDSDNHIYNVSNLDSFIKGTMRITILNILKQWRTSNRHKPLEYCDEDAFISTPSTFIEAEDRQHLANIVDDCLSKLKPSERQYLEMRQFLVMGDLPAEAKDIATHLNLSPGGVRTGICTGRAKLKSCLESKNIPTDEGNQ